jgi:hypothetical protein
MTTTAAPTSPPVSPADGGVSSAPTNAQRLESALLELTFAIVAGVAATLLLIHFVASALPLPDPSAWSAGGPPRWLMSDSPGDTVAELGLNVMLVREPEALAARAVLTRIWPALLAAAILLPLAASLGAARRIDPLGALVSAVAFWVAFCGALFLTYAKVFQFTREDLLAAQHADLVAMGFRDRGLTAIVAIETMFGQTTMATLFAAAAGLLFVGLSRSAGSYARRRGAGGAGAAGAADEVAAGASRSS